ncbi:glutamate receptor 2-like isoform X2 [Phymastichus coffea]|uniref:glutamate receptor 2-like isoform X2 n=1 Tax=Phymastichus coffea TaxID=108790 RepID=UPI00273C2902|nr:glutamate receptor 2-like isoform X2 [Phymastichus coffea]
MRTSLKSYHLFLILLKLAEGLDDITNFTTLTENVQKFYLAKSIFIIYNKPKTDFDIERIIFEAIKIFSSKYSMSQAITYNELRQKPPHRDNVLHTLLIQDRKNLQLAINATRNVEMSFNPWLLLFSKSSTFDCNKPGKGFFNMRMDTKMVAKCWDNKVLKRYYSVFPDQTEVIDLAEWTPENKLKFKDSQSLHEVETNMRGIVLKVARRACDIEAANIHLTNFLSQLMRELETFGNFKTEVTVRDASLGFRDDNTMLWSGLINVVHENRVDIGNFLFSMSRTRLSAVDFAAPIAKARYYLFAKLPKYKKVRWAAYFQVFDLYIWATVGFSILIVSIILVLMKRECHGNFVHTYFGNFINVLGIYCQQGLAETPTNSSMQIIYFSIFTSSLVLNAIYSATITSYITLLSPTLPFATYEDFKSDVSYKVTVAKNTRDETLILQYGYLKSLKSRLKNSCELPIDPYEGFKQACEPKTAFYSDEVQFNGITYGAPCQLGRLDMKRAEYVSLILTKNSPYTKALSYFIERLRDHGILERLKDKYFYNYTEIPRNEPNIINFQEVLPILSVWIIGVVLRRAPMILQL